MSLTIKTLREEVGELNEAAATLDDELARAGDLPVEVLADVLLRTRKMWRDVLKLADVVKEQGAPLFAPREGGETSAPTEGKGPGVAGGEGKPRKRPPKKG